MSPVPPSHHLALSPQLGVTEVDAINNNLEVSIPRRSHLSRSPRQELNPPTSTSPIAAKHNHEPHPVSPCVRLNEWLIKQGIDQTSRTVILNEAFTFEDFVYEMQKEDLLRIGLK